MEKRFYKSTTDKKLAGVCAGVAEYFEVDPTLVRLIWVVFTFAGGAGILAYIIAAIIMPEAPTGSQPVKRKKKPQNQPHAVKDNGEESITEIQDDQEHDYAEDHVEDYSAEDLNDYADETNDDEFYEVDEVDKKKDDKNSMVLGVALILIGLMFFSRNFFKWFWIDFSYLWPILLILLGVVLVVNKRK